MRRFRLLPTERWALFLLSALIALRFVWDPLVRGLWILAFVPLGLAWLVGLLLALFGLGWALRDHDLWHDRVRAAAAMPLALILAVLLGGVASDAGRRASAALHLATHDSQMAAAQAREGAGNPALLPYIEGVPDGGVAIIRSSSLRPEELPGSEQLRLTGERIRHCGAIGGDDYVCGYD